MENEPLPFGTQQTGDRQQRFLGKPAGVLAWYCHLPKVIFLNLPLICKIKDNVFSFKKEILKYKTHTQSVENTHF